LQIREPSERHAPRRLRIAAVSLLLVAYALLSHYSNTHASGGLGAALALTPLLAAGLALLWRVSNLVIALLAGIVAAVLLYDCWALFEQNFSIVYLLQECGMYGLLAFGFGHSLRGDQIALCTRFADQLHGPLSEREVRYTRRVTAAWSAFFATITLIILLLYVLTPRAVWSAFVNLIAIPLIALMFVAEYAVRRRVLPQSYHSGILASVRIFFASR
jgi:uncharacterized membrane protein